MLVVKKSVSIVFVDDCGDTIFGWMSMRMMVKMNLDDDDVNARRRLCHISFFVTIIFISSVIACQAKRVNVVVEAIAFASDKRRISGRTPWTGRRGRAALLYLSLFLDLLQNKCQYGTLICYNILCTAIDIYSYFTRIGTTTSIYLLILTNIA